MSALTGSFGILSKSLIYVLVSLLVVYAGMAALRADKGGRHKQSLGVLHVLAPARTKAKAAAETRTTMIEKVPTEIGHAFWISRHTMPHIDYLLPGH